jgi:ATP-dependent protease HslVU (ClpYQ) ATPase subunit
VGSSCALALLRGCGWGRIRASEKVFLIDAEYVKQMVAAVVKDQDLSRYIL